MLSPHRRQIGLAFMLVIIGALRAGDSAERKSNGYCLFARDMIRVSVHGEPDLSVERRLDGNGRVSLPMLGSVVLQGLSVTAAEEKIRTTYIEQELLVRPQGAVT